MTSLSKSQDIQFIWLFIQQFLNFPAYLNHLWKFLNIIYVQALSQTYKSQISRTSTCYLHFFTVSKVILMITMLGNSALLWSPMVHLPGFSALSKILTKKLKEQDIKKSYILFLSLQEFFFLKKKGGG